MSKVISIVPVQENTNPLPMADAWYPLWWPPTKIAGRELASYLDADLSHERIQKEDQAPAVAPIRG